MNKLSKLSNAECKGTPYKKYAGNWIVTMHTNKPDRGLHCFHTLISEGSFSDGSSNEEKLICCFCGKTTGGEHGPFTAQFKI